MSPALNGSSAIWHFKHTNAIEIYNGKTFDFYTGLPHIVMTEINALTKKEWLAYSNTALNRGICKFVGGTIQ